MLDRRLFTSMSYPADYGYIEGTLAEDGDPLDALVLVSEPTFPGCRIRVRPVGVFHMADEKGPDEKVICVPLNDPALERASPTSTTCRRELRNEIEHFFQVYKDLERQQDGDARLRQPRRGAGDHRGLPRASRRLALRPEELVQDRDGAALRDRDVLRVRLARLDADQLARPREEIADF